MRERAERRERQIKRSSDRESGRRCTYYTSTSTIFSLRAKFAAILPLQYPSERSQISLPHSFHHIVHYCIYYLVNMNRPVIDIFHNCYMLSMHLSW